ncbi:MAG: adenylosuccinate lyase [Peptococcaceae bacterium]|nr:adenylosuccinate lyase [Peptococcaceae bacterium]
MISRYTHPAMGKIFNEANEFQKWLDVEIAVCEVLAEDGKIPGAALQQVIEGAKVDVARIRAIEAEVRHDLIAFLQSLAEQVGDSAKYIHLGLTSSDVKDTALSLQLVEAAHIVEQDLIELLKAVAVQAKQHKLTIMVGRTHGIHAEPTTFGLKLALWYAELERHLERLRQATVSIRVGKISGAVGTFANIEPQVEARVCARLGLDAAKVSSQILQRDRHAHFVSTLALIGSSLDKFATEVRNLQRTDILELEEAFAKGQKGSSAMPHKRNPITCEQIAGLARVLRGNSLAAMENVALWHERDMTHSSVERIILPDSCILLDHMLRKFTGVVENLQVYPANMEKNLRRTYGITNSQRVLLALVEKGMSRQDAYGIVQKNAFAAWEQGSDFCEVIKQDPQVAMLLTREEVDNLFDYEYHLKHVEDVFARLGLT